MDCLSALSRVLLRLSSSGATGAMELGQLTLLFETGELVGFVERRQGERRQHDRPQCDRHKHEPHRTLNRSSDRRKGESELTELLVRLCQEAGSRRELGDLVSWTSSSKRSDFVPAQISASELVMCLSRTMRTSDANVNTHASARSSATFPSSLSGRFRATRELHIPKRATPTERALLLHLASGSVLADALSPDERSVLSRWYQLGLVRRAQAGSAAELLRVTRAVRAGKLEPAKARRRQAAQLHPDRFDAELKHLSESALKAILST